MPTGVLFEELDTMDEEFRGLVVRVQEALAQSVSALVERNVTQAAQVIAGEEVVDELDNRVGARCHRILLLFQPVAHDLRQVIAVSRMTLDLERIGDYAVRIAEQAATLSTLPKCSIPPDLATMGEEAVEMVRLAVDSYSRRDAHTARRVCRANATVRALGIAITEKVIDAMKASPDAVDTGVCFLSVIESLQRVAGHATNIAEDDVFLTEARSIRHHWDDECRIITG